MAPVEPPGPQSGREIQAGENIASSVQTPTVASTAPMARSGRSGSERRFSSMTSRPARSPTTNHAPSPKLSKSPVATVEPSRPQAFVARACGGNSRAAGGSAGSNVASDAIKNAQTASSPSAVRSRTRSRGAASGAGAAGAAASLAAPKRPPKGARGESDEGRGRSTVAIWGVLSIQTLQGSSCRGGRPPASQPVDPFRLCRILRPCRL